MSESHFGGNTLPEITREEHAGDINSKRVVSVDTIPTHSTKSNASLVLSYTGDNLTTIQKVIGGVTYTQTLGYDGSNNLISISAWS